MSTIDHWKIVDAPTWWLEERGFEYPEFPQVVSNNMKGLIIRVQLPFDINDNLILPKRKQSSPRRSSPKRSSPKRSPSRRSSKKTIRQRLNKMMSSLRRK